MSRGNGIVSAKRREQARKHATRVWTCICGKVCRGNGGISSHFKACPSRAAARIATVNTTGATS